MKSLFLHYFLEVVKGVIKVGGFTKAVARGKIFIISVMLLGTVFSTQILQFARTVRHGSFAIQS
jgi:hypothetical protein